MINAASLVPFFYFAGDFRELTYARADLPNWTHLCDWHRPQLALK
jgi:hypothetical protein